MLAYIDCGSIQCNEIVIRLTVLKYFATVNSVANTG